MQMASRLMEWIGLTLGDLPSGQFMTNGVKDVYPLVTEHKRNDDKFSTERLLQLTKAVGANDMISKLEQLRREESMLKTVDTQKCVSNLIQQCSSSAFLKPDIGRPKQEVKDACESLAQQSLNFSLATPLGSSSSVLPFHEEIIEGVEQSEVPSNMGKLQSKHCQSQSSIVPQPFQRQIMAKLHKNVLLGLQLMDGVGLSCFLGTGLRSLIKNCSNYPET